MGSWLFEFGPFVPFVSGANDQGQLCMCLFCSFPNSET